VPTISRTLVKSPPELWELVDDEDLMARWSAVLLGAFAATTVSIVERAPGERLVWEASAAGRDARIELALAEKGWGTQVSIRVLGAGARVEDRTEERLLDELGSPQRRPFSRN
jgi:uncharacterized protein YndB with AHSA1/START domain